MPPECSFGHLAGLGARLIDRAYTAYVALGALRRPKGFRTAPDGLPLPPPRLIATVAGTPDADWFLESGRRAARAIREALDRQNAELGRLDSILDFGCGCGRVVRHWAGLNGVAVSGSDYNPGLVRWCRQNLPFARFEVNGLEPPLAFDSDSFDLVYALSVFTHLPEATQRRWLEEFRRVLRPRGHLLLTTHGAAYRNRLHADERERFDAGELVVRRERLAGTNLCTTFHPESYVRNRLAPELELIAFVPEGATGNPHQDLVLLRA